MHGKFSHVEFTVLLTLRIHVASSLCGTTVLYEDYFGTLLLLTLRIHVARRSPQILLSLPEP